MPIAEPRTRTRRENLRRTLAGDEPAWVPLSLNIGQWFHHHKMHGTLPDELRGCADHVDAMKMLGCDIFTRNIDGGVRERNRTVQPKVIVEKNELGERTTTLLETPFGSLRSVAQSQAAISAIPHTEEYFVKDWHRDGDAFRFLLDQRECDWDASAFATIDGRIGDDGLVNVPAAVSPLKMLHTYFGLDHTCLFAMDEPEAAKDLCERYWSRARPLLQKLAAHPEVDCAILMDNLDTPFYPPSVAEDLWLPYVTDATDIMRSRSKYLFVHACGKLRGMAAMLAHSRVSGLESISHPPLGDWTPVEAVACHDRMVYFGGFSAHEQEMMTPKRMASFYREEFFPKFPRRRAIFGASCNVAIDTGWDRVCLMRDLVREFSPDDAAVSP